MLVNQESKRQRLHSRHLEEKKMLSELDKDWLERFASNEGEYEAVKKYLEVQILPLLEHATNLAEGAELNGLSDESIGSYMRTYATARRMIKKSFSDLKKYGKVEIKKPNINQAV